MSNASSPRRPIRWWPAALIVAVALGALLWAWAFATMPSTQHRVQATAQTIILAGFALVVWLLLLSRLRWRHRLAALGGLVLLGALAAALVRIEGVSGDLVPQLAWRFAAEPDYREAADTGTTFASWSADDYPQFLGPNRDGALPALALARDWQETPPQELWRIPVGSGWSGFAVVGDAAITHEQRGDQLVVARYDAATGEAVWTTGRDGGFTNVVGGDGPRTTPTIVDGRVVAIGPNGVIEALDLSDGRRLWQRDLVAELGMTLPDWGYAASPLLLDSPDGERLLVLPVGGDGRGLVALQAGG
ncbi:MAG: PQQ-binding-like beta-propeller repeat protein, partial [Acidobacteriota bacterium]